jgi:adenosine deaminase
VRFAPQLHASIDPADNFDLPAVISAVNDGLLRAKNEYNNQLINENEPEYNYGIIVSAMRMFTSKMGRYYDALCAVHPYASKDRIAALASEALVRVASKCRYEDNIPVVALDIAGAENGYKNNAHTEAFDFAHNCFLNKTVHAGESYGPESIFQAVRDLHAERIGHGYHLFSSDLVCGTGNLSDAQGYVTRLTKYICDRRICIEVCLTSNMNTMPGLLLHNHTFKKMLLNSVSVCLNTDNRLVSATTTVLELKKAIEAFQLTPKQVRNIVLNGFKRSFYIGTFIERQNYIQKIVTYYDQIASQFGVDVNGDEVSSVGQKKSL